MLRYRWIVCFVIPNNSHEIQPSTTNWGDCICVVVQLIFSYVTNIKLLSHSDILVAC